MKIISDKKLKTSSLLSTSVVILLMTSCNQSPTVSSTEEATEEIHKIVINNIKPTYYENRVRANIKLTQTNLLALLPDLAEYPLALPVKDSQSVEVVEIITSSEKAGKGNDGLYIEMAKRFNQMQKKTSKGKQAAINIRKMTGGLGVQFMIARQYTPDAYSPSHALWADMLSTNGIKTTLIAKKTAPNTAGIVIKKAKVPLITENGKLDIGKLLTHVSSGSFAMGYTNPYLSSTGLNFLLTVLNSFAQGDESQMLSPDVASAFEAFQTGVPFVAQNTLKMRDATLNSDVLDAFIIEYQSWINIRGMDDYQFIPFGIRHDSPLYATPEADQSEREVLKMFSNFMMSQKAEIKQFGFDRTPDYQDAYRLVDKSIIGQAQKLWKEKKSGGKPAAAFFVADVSGSMEGVRLKNLTKALIESSDLISASNAIGMISYNGVVNVDLLIKQFDLQQKSLLIGASERFFASGKTATNNAVLVAIDRLNEFAKKNPEYKKIIFVLSDGITNRGYDFQDAKELLEWSGISIHTIAYELSSDHLKQMSDLTEGSYIESSTGSASYWIGNMLNAEM